MATTSRVNTSPLDIPISVSPRPTAAMERSGIAVSFRHWAGVAALMIIAAVATSVMYVQQSLRLDEAQSLWQSSHSVHRILEIVAQDVHVPLYHTLLHIWEVIFGVDVAAARSLSLAFFIMTIPAVYMLGRIAFDSRTGLFAATAATVSPFLSWYASEIRMYSMLAFITVLHQYFFMRLYKKGSSFGTWCGYAATALIGVFVHYFFLLALLTEAIFYAIHRKSFPERSFRKFVFSASLVCMALAPWLLYVRKLGFASTTQPHLTSPSTVDLFNAFSQFLFGFQNDQINTLILSFWPVLVLLVFLLLRKNIRFSAEPQYFFLSAFLPVAAAFAISVAIKPIFVSRYLILVVPSMYIFLAWMTSRYPPALARALKASMLIIMALMFVHQRVAIASLAGENYEQAASYISQNAESRDVIVLSAPFTVYPFEYYYAGTAGIQTLPVWNRFQFGPIPAFSPEELDKDVAAVKDAHRRAWLLLSYNQGYEDQVRTYFDTHFERLEQRNFSRGLTLYVYKFRYDDANIKKDLSSISPVQPIVKNP